MMSTIPQPCYQSWSALPLFDRISSPDHINSFSPDFNGYEPPMLETGLLSADFSDFCAYPFSTVDLGPQQLYEVPNVRFEHGLVTPPIEPCVTKSHDLIDATPSDLIILPNFTEPSGCPFPNCKSVAIFDSGRDFRRHYRQHFKRFFCRYAECPQSAQDLREVDGRRGFATRKDRARHESKHKPTVQCPWHDQDGRQCLRVFSRVDNMRDHYRRIHKKKL
ncbi:transcription factor [Fusarium flagelliforme]|uniref:Transcription factor n=1 Tax=Fusarium sp. NRRL 13405 TaxID=694269 RepID=D1LC86_9HYPO|nr:transcription factor [Fusarium flagelliforme]ACZ51407.1 transcription factor [Fusarium sp. NRRL 13405]KAH7174901.1 transcription factor [Fusarium flagelliforme]